MKAIIISGLNNVLTEQGTVTEVAKPKIKKPPMYQVILLNDDYTPMDFVVEILEKFFAMDEQRAALIMWQVHLQGKGICGVFSRDIAETKVSQVNDYARGHEYPLLCKMEKV